MQGKTHYGVVKFYKEEEGFGFVISEEGEEIFVHITGLRPGVRLEKGEGVSFEIIRGKKGINAVNVRPLC
jgi:CspA family cold shock protein